MSRTREQNREYMRRFRSGHRVYRKRGLDWSNPAVRANYQKQYRRKEAGIPDKIGKFEKLVTEYGDSVRLALTKIKLATMMPRIQAAFNDLEPRQDRHCGGYVRNGHRVGGYHT